jgi:hypothetical protein
MVERRVVSRWAAVIPVLLALLSGCVVVERQGMMSPSSRPAADEGMLVYAVGALSFEVPADWTVRGDANGIEARPQDGSAKIDVRRNGRPFEAEADCFADAQQSLARGSVALANVRRHPTTIARRRGVTQEADAGAWHGWAYALCDETVQYRLFLTGVSPVKPETLEAFRLLIASAQLGGQP